MARSVPAITVDSLLEQALQLSEDDRELLATHLLCTIDKEPGYDEAWAEEIRRRLNSIDDGTARVAPLEDAVARVRHLLDS